MEGNMDVRVHKNIVGLMQTGQGLRSATRHAKSTVIPQWYSTSAAKACAIAVFPDPLGPCNMAISGSVCSGAKA